MAFNAWGCYTTGIDTHDRDMIEQLKMDPSLIDSFDNRDQAPEFRKRLVEMKGVKIPTHRAPPNDYVSFEDENNFASVGGNIHDTVQSLSW
jgi:hypothetical protein